MQPEQLLEQILKETYPGAGVVGLTTNADRFVHLMSDFYEAQWLYEDQLCNGLLKVCDGARFPVGRGELEFYRFARTQTSEVLVPCFGDFLDLESGIAALLLQDMGDGFVRSAWPEPPAFEHCARAVRALAQTHNLPWDIAQARQLRPSFQHDQARLAQALVALHDKQVDGLNASDWRLLEDAVQHFPTRHLLRLDGPRVTVTHNDSHFWNFLIPIDPAHPARLIDWQLWGVDLAAADLAYMLALHMDSARRVHDERRLVAGYADAAGLEFAPLWEDYRFAVAGLLNRVLVYSTVIPDMIWRRHLTHTLMAVRELGAEEFLI